MTALRLLNGIALVTCTSPPALLFDSQSRHNPGVVFA
jgi:hypothetical protein